MNDEIKEIIEYLKSDNWEVGNGDYEKSLYKCDIELLLDYITNLEQELTIMIKDDERSQETIIRLTKENERLKDTLAKIKDLNTMQYLNEKKF